MKTNITYIISNINKAFAFEWIATYLNKEKFTINFILLNPGSSVLEEYLIQNNIPVHRISYTNKKDIPKAIFKTYNILKNNKSTIIHTHLFDANIVGLIAGWLARVPKRIHTRHHCNYHHMYYPKAVKYDKLVNKLSTHIIAISQVVQDTLIEVEKVSAKKIRLIHHGFKLDEFTNISSERKAWIKKKYNPEGRNPVIGNISRYIHLKGIQYVIPAFKKTLEKYPNAYLILANTNGNYKNEIKHLLTSLPPDSYQEIEFENDIFAIYSLFDVFTHTPINNNCEAFGQTYIEALASEVPSIFTLSGIANEFIKNEENALLVPYKNSDAIYNAIVKILQNQLLSHKITQNGKKDVSNLFELSKMILSLEQLYEKK